MTMRKIVFGAYDTWQDWGLTLTSYELSAPEYKSNFVSVPCRDGDIDLSTVLTDGEPRYNNRELTATFEISSGTRDSRVELFSKIINALDGRSVNITLPDDTTHYITGRCSVSVGYNDLAHGEISVAAVCQPWRFANDESVRSTAISSTAATVTLTNNGRRVLTPTIIVSSSATIVFGPNTVTLSAGTSKLPELQMPSGDTSVTASGSGSIKFLWREAVL